MWRLSVRRDIALKASKLSPGQLLHAPEALKASFHVSPQTAKSPWRPLSFWHKRSPRSLERGRKCLAKPSMPQGNYSIGYMSPTPQSVDQALAAPSDREAGGQDTYWLWQDKWWCRTPPLTGGTLKHCSAGTPRKKWNTAWNPSGSVWRLVIAQCGALTPANSWTPTQPLPHSPYSAPAGQRKNKKSKSKETCSRRDRDS